MSDLTLFIVLMVALLIAGLLRAFVDKNIAIFGVTASAVGLMLVSAALYEMGSFYQWMEFVLVVLLLVFGVVFTAFNRTEKAKHADKLRKSES